MDLTTADIMFQVKGAFTVHISNILEGFTDSVGQLETN